MKEGNGFEKVTSQAVDEISGKNDGRNMTNTTQENKPHKNNKRNSGKKTTITRFTTLKKETQHKKMNQTQKKKNHNTKILNLIVSILFGGTT